MIINIKFFTKKFEKMSNLTFITIPFDENELKSLSIETKEKSSLNGSEVWDIISKIDVEKILKENDSLIISFLNVIIFRIFNLLLYL